MASSRKRRSNAASPKHPEAGRDAESSTAREDRVCKDPAPASQREDALGTREHEADRIGSDGGENNRAIYLSRTFCGVSGK